MNKNSLLVSIIVFLVLMLLVSPLNPFLTGFIVNIENDHVPENAYANGNARFILPSNAVKINPGLYKLGEKEVNGRKIEGFAFIDYKGNNGKPTGCEDDGVCKGWEDASCADCQGSGGDTGTNTEKCYSYISKNTKWRTVEPYIVNPSNTEGLGDLFVTSNIAADITKWELIARTDIIGLGSVTDTALIADTVSPDGFNEVYFGDIDEPGAIGVTIVWGVFSGPPSQRELIEWDQIYDQVDYDWSGTVETGKMNFENIATHELGHTMGLGDLYDTQCSEMTMYGYANTAEVKKQTLENGDIKGIQQLYK